MDFFIRLGKHVNHGERMNPIDFEGQRSHRDHFVRLLWFRGSVRLSVPGPCECDRVYTVAYFFVKLGRHVNHDVVPWFAQHCCGSVVPSVCPCVDLVNAIESTPLHISLSNLEDMLTMMRGCTLLILEVRGQRSRSQWTSMEISFWTQ